MLSLSKSLASALSSSRLDIRSLWSELVVCQDEKAREEILEKLLRLLGQNPGFGAHA
jgi:hypothetical protein